MTHDDVTRSQLLLLDAEDRDRRRLERELHNGVQQALVSLRIRLSLLQERLEVVAPEEAELTEALGVHLEQAIDQLRMLARDIYPRVLADHGLPAALQAVARGSTRPIALELDAVTRQRPEVERSVYFVCLAALANVDEHAGDAKQVKVTLRQSADLEFEVRDDGPGFDIDAAGGPGLAAMQERVRAVGGELTVRSAAGQGTVIRGTIPAARRSPVGQSN